MKMTNQASRWTRLLGVFALASTVAVAACDTDRLLEVDEPDFINPDAFNDPDLIDVVVNGALSEFVLAYAGDGGDAYISVSALMGDELFSSGTFTTRTNTDRRDQFSIQNGNTSDGAYVNFQQARRALRDAAVQVEAALGADSDEWGLMKALEGYTYTGLAEGYCVGVPISSFNAETNEFEFGNPTTTADLLNDAVVRFDEAIANGGSAADLARVGKGRALLSLGDYPGAASAVSTVADEYVYFIENSENATNNAIWGLQANGRYSISDLEGGNDTGLPYRGADDTRVQWFQDPSQPNGFDAAYALYKSAKYTNPVNLEGRGSPFALATGVEARLIEAEAALNNDTDYSDMTAILNALRTDVHALMAEIQPGYVAGDDLPALAVPATEDEAVDQLFYERGFWLFLTGHRLGDLRRLVRDYGRDQADVYPSGAYHKGGDHGPDVVFPVDFDEDNNPNYSIESCDVEAV